MKGAAGPGERERLGSRRRGDGDSWRRGRRDVRQRSGGSCKREGRKITSLVAANEGKRKINK